MYININRFLNTLEKKRIRKIEKNFLFICKYITMMIEKIIE